MRLVIPFLGFEISIVNGGLYSIIIENPTDFRKVIEDLWQQTNGQSGEIILSEKGKIISFRERALVVFNPVDINANNRKVLNTLFKELNENALNSLSIELADLQSNIIAFFDKLSETVPYDVSYNYEVDVPELLKCHKFEINQLNGTYLDRLIDYLRAYSRICRTRVVILVNLKNYVSEEEVEALEEFVIYEDLKLIILQNSLGYRKKEEKTWIIDKDRCTINLN